MCRFLMVKSEVAVVPGALLVQFAGMARASPQREGAWQGDGWGIAWLDAAGSWQEYRSLAPVWTEVARFEGFPPARRWLVHARSASFPHHRDVIEYNQPFTAGAHAFVFNGFLQGVNLPFRLAGRIGAQKIWTLLRRELAVRPPAEALAAATATIVEHTRAVQALNVGLCDGDNLYAYSTFSGDPAYYRLWQLTQPGLAAICSAPLPGYPFEPAPIGRVFHL